MKYLFLIAALLVSNVYAGGMFKLDRETAKVLVMNAMTYKREVLLTNKLEGLHVTDDSAYLDLTVLPQYRFIKDQLDFDVTFEGQDYGAMLEQSYAEMGVFFKVGETFIEVTVDKKSSKHFGDTLSNINIIVDSVALMETYLRFLKERGIARSEKTEGDPVQEAQQSMCNGVCWSINKYCKVKSAVQLSNCIGFCENHPIPPPNCFDTCVLERNFRDLECDIDYLICLDNCGGGC